MDFTSQDIAVIEKALRLAMNTVGTDSQARHFGEVLVKLQKNAAVPLTGTYRRTLFNGGVCYDYDDSSEML
ncbi:hypothetical protein [Paenibacillus xerothermodurans]|uniref:Uncharacterized protein n=1 Tax=Paenibacillus xerothermodurans TaxID=1977292 RepID=A0A2W1NVT5_PAEXE|nr:hypothetical protein [Paenibacillus xerothermodurans]PZE21826.1 hypothetical protein CBW46_005325 [Paenibacillus xerothermodurans]